MQELNSLIGELYDAALDSTRWEIALTAVAAYRDAISAGIVVFDTRTRTLRNQIMSDGDSRSSRDFLDTYGALMPPEFYNASLMTVDKAICSIDAIDRRVFESSRFFREWVEPNGLVDSSACCLMKDVNRFAMAAFFLAREATDRDRELSELFGVHIRRAATISDLLNYRLVELMDFENTLNTLSAPMMLVDEAGTIHFANHAAEAILRHGGLLRSAKGRISAGSTALTKALHAKICEVIRSTVPTAAVGIGVPGEHGPRSGAVLHILPVERHLSGSLPIGPRAVVFVGTQSARPMIGPNILSAVFGLKPTESEVMLHLAQGSSIEEVAEVRDCAVSTVRTHLLKVLSKTGSRRQSDLVRIVHQLAL
ncbi:LuxR C-terminal-related transcriptional regulator (plasmid) [Salipiger sp. H15]|uniref:LuxR C-terminal-related transcriptional regulator n=1 Tax=Alloyangia sp. H15 TaxID=3029062 RepID=A0AAU8AST8_9RHOB